MLPSNWWLLALPFIAGAFLPLQSGINGQLAKQLSSVLAAAFISFAVGTLALLILVISQREMPGLAGFKGLTWWHWVGGLLGAFFIATAAFAGPKVGAVLFVALVIAGQLAMAITLDNFGWAGFREAPITVGKFAGLLLILSGIWMIRRS